MSIDNLIKRLQNIMRQDAGIDGDAQRIGQIVWMLFLKVYDSKEELWELHDDDYESIIPEELRWRNWAVDNKDGSALTAEALLEFVNGELFPKLKGLEIDDTTERKSAIVKYVFEDANNYMKNGVLLRQIINIIDEVDFTEYEERHAFGDIYETILKDLQSAGKSGEFYTPRAVTDFIAEVLSPQVGDKIADFACGTGGFLTSALSLLEKQIKSPKDKEIVNQSIYGVEKKALPHLLCMTNLLLHDIDEPYIEHMNSLAKPIRDYKEKDKFDIVLMNPPYGGTEEKSIQINFPVDMQTSETSFLFMVLIMYRLKANGKAGVVLPDNFLFDNDNTKMAIKEKLLNDFNLHTIVRLPKNVFAPYTDIATNLLFFDKGEKTREIWYYEHKIPEEYKNYSKTKPIQLWEFDDEKEWWNNRVENERAWKVSLEDVIKNKYNLDFKNPHNNTIEKEQSSTEIIDSLIKSVLKINELLNSIKENNENV